MKIEVILTLVLVYLFGGVTYISAAGTAIIYALGNNQAAKGKRVFFGILGVAMFYLAIYTAVWFMENGRTLF